ncbi:LPS-assembly protein LptD [Aestuariivirga sp.]|uniref:LPS-assembly protein LptD n=1 Tax=Aestuariivirga sp. TaxID=2650926 RepID=UPI003783CB50
MQPYRAEQCAVKTSRRRLRLLAAMALAGCILASPASLAGIENQPPLVEPSVTPPPKGTRVDVIADRLTYDAKTKVAVATGTVRITYGPYVLTASKVVYEMATDTFKANGSIVLREPNGNVFEADSAELKNSFREGFGNYVKALLTNNVTITAQYAQRTSDGITTYERASYTACKTCVSEDGTPVWQIAAREAKHNEKTETIYYRDATLKFGKLPVLWTPYFAYPDPSVTRRTGFLIPSIKSGDFGFGAAVPFFWAMRPNMDMTVTPLLTTERGGAGDIEFRHRLESGIYSVHGYGNYDPNVSEFRSDVDSQRGAVRTKGDFRINEDWTWGWDGTAVSDNYFLADYGYDSRNLLANYVQATGLSDRNYTKAQIIGWQSLVEGEEQGDMPVATPFVVGDYVLDRPVMGGELSFGFNAYALQRNEAIDESYQGVNVGTQQTHVMGYADWKRQMIAPAGMLVTPFAQVRADAFYAENVPGAAESKDSEFHLTPTGGIDVRMPFVASHGGLQSVLTPVAQLVGTPSEPDLDGTGNEDAITLNFDTTNLFLSDRFTGYDRWEGGLRANTGLIYTLMGENGGFLRASFGESFHIAGENSFLAGSGLDGTASDLVAGVALQVLPRITLGYQARMEEDLSSINVQEGTVGLNFGQFSGSVSYADIGPAANYGRPGSEEQVWVNGRYNLSNVWSVFGNVQYDLKNQKRMNESLGVAFNCDCMKAELVYAMSQTDEFGPNGDTQYRVFLSVELRTIGRIAYEYIQQ